jgi:hypothetical protein
MKKVLRSVGAVVAGLAATVVLSIATDTVLEATGVYPPVEVQREVGFTTGWMVALALAYRTLFAGVGGYVTAALAPSRPMRHAGVLGAIGIVVGLLGVLAARDLAPAWYSIALVLTGPPAVLLGAAARLVVAGRGHGGRSPAVRARSSASTPPTP